MGFSIDLHELLEPRNQVTCGDNLGEAPQEIPKEKKKDKFLLFDQTIPCNDSQGMVLLLCLNMQCAL